MWMSINRISHFELYLKAMRQMGAPTNLIDALSKVPKICNNVVFPAPEGPTIATTSPFFIVKSTPFKTSKSP